MGTNMNMHHQNMKKKVFWEKVFSRSRQVNKAKMSRVIKIYTINQPNKVYPNNPRVAKVAPQLA